MKTADSNNTPTVLVRCVCGIAGNPQMATLAVPLRPFTHT